MPVVVGDETPISGPTFTYISRKDVKFRSSQAPDDTDPFNKGLALCFMMWLSTGIATIGLAFYSPSKKGNEQCIHVLMLPRRLAELLFLARQLTLNIQKKRGPGTYQTKSFPSDNRKCDPASITTSQKGLLCENAKTRAVDVVARGEAQLDHWSRCSVVTLRSRFIR
ncbi:hypothetical protein QR685DRAFT_606920 [Neurospora intermedia]|uniref:Uncharacterized protein n=1 Tax=Neurospora intermedia TaxID=5142 RepID=A0ABR3DAX3_NEUIN